MPLSSVLEKQWSLGVTTGLHPESPYPFSVYTKCDPVSEGNSYSVPHRAVGEKADLDNHRCLPLRK